jgi:homocitrate synthase
MCGDDLDTADNGQNGQNGQASQNGANGLQAHTANGHHSAHNNFNHKDGEGRRQASMPYQTTGDFLSNTNNFKIIESTLREGEQFANAFFDTATKIKMFVASFQS